MNSKFYPQARGIDVRQNPLMARSKSESGPDTVQASEDLRKRMKQYPSLGSRLSSQSHSRESETNTLVRKNKPARAVFNDLQTAHSSITSGSVRSRHRAGSRHTDETIDEENSIPLQDFEQGNTHGHSQVHARLCAPLTTMPLQDHKGACPARIGPAAKSLCAENGGDQIQGAYSFRTLAPSGPAGVDAALTQHNSSIYPDSLAAGTSPSQNAGFGRRMRDGISGISNYDDSDDDDDHDDYAAFYVEDGGFRQGHLRGKRDPRSRQHSDAHSGPYETSSIPDGSTVGNIYRHYMQSEDGESNTGDESEIDIPRHSSSRGYWNERASSHGFPSSPVSRKQKKSFPAQLREKALAARKKDTFFPEYPVKPTTSSKGRDHLAVRDVGPSTSQGVRHPSSHRNTRNLLQVTKEAGLANENPFLGHTQTQMLDFNIRSKQCSHHLKTNNPFAQRPEVVVSPASLHGGQISERVEMRDRLPLEREVSKALRRASGISGYSDGSITTSAPDRYADLPSETSTYQAIRSLLRRNAGITPPSDSGSIREVDQAIALPVRSFYDQHALAGNFVASQQQNVVRVAIKRNGAFPDSPPDSPRGCIAPSFGHQRQLSAADDGNDWETVGGSLAGKGPLPVFLGGDVGQAGSSIADHSEDGTISSHVPEIESFGSTERIAQHPGHIQYYGDYRQRDLKKTRMPIFLPVFREHKVNGYLADSTRIRPTPNPFQTTPRPLGIMHANPFQVTPPEVMPITRGPQRRRGLENLFPPSAKEELSRTGNGDTNRRTPAENKAGQSRQIYRSDQDDSWMDDFGDPGPAIKTPQKDQALTPLYPENYNPWKYRNPVVTADSAFQPYYDGAGRDYRGGNIVQDVASSSERNSAIIEWQSKSHMDVLGEVSSYGHKQVLKQSQDRKLFVKGPPGAFYQGVRSRPDSKPATWGHQGEHSGFRRGSIRSIRNFPTNALRPLSLLARRRPSVTFDASTINTSENIENDFIYRSPLAPPKRNSWQQLYSGPQMQRIREAAKADGIFSSQKTMPGDTASSRQNIGAQKRLLEAPRLTIFRREASTETNMMHQKKNISLIVLLLCTVFPPLLLLFAASFLDCLMTWWTNGQCSSFDKRHKRVAYLLVYTWCLVIFLGLIAFLVYWFAFAHPIGS
ncbi:hypothetical protein BGZ60DRAFT_525099 [Tricladium varicosporioides]|nr:hypothetical protein BGZ60DRAFT_525099 [Hymenoscyphus varicosporioides]